jgi:hypothetical protein
MLSDSFDAFFLQFHKGLAYALNLLAHSESVKLWHHSPHQNPLLIAEIIALFAYCHACKQ